MMVLQSLMGCCVLLHGYLLLCPVKACLFRIPAREVFTKAKYLLPSRLVCAVTSLLFLLLGFLGRDTGRQIPSAAVDAFVCLFQGTAL